MADHCADKQDVVVQDAQGRMVSETDFGSHHLAYSYDLAGRLHQRSNDYIPSWADQGYASVDPAGETLVYRYYNTGLTAEQSSGYAWEGTENIGDGVHLPVSIGDTIDTLYAYDENGNLKQEDTIRTGRGTVYDPTDAATLWSEHEVATYDALDRMLTLTDTAPTSLPSGVTNGVDDPVSITFSYDANGNIRRRQSSYYLLSDTGVVSTTQSSDDFWYKYDRMNRFTVTKGTKDGSNNIVHGSYGTELTYDAAGRRVTAVTEVFGGSTIETDSYHFAADGTLYQTDIVSGGTTRHAYSTMDTMGRVTLYRETDAAGTMEYYKREATYDYDSLVTHDVVTSLRTDNKTDIRTTDYTYTANLDGDPALEFLGGVVTATATTETLTGAATTHVGSSYVYAWFSGAVEATELYDSDTTDSGNGLYTSTLVRDAREDLIHADIHDGVMRSVRYQSTVDGLVTQRDTVGAGAAPHARYWYFGGVQMGDVSNDGTSNVDYVTAIARHRAVPGSGFFTNGATAGVHVGDFDQSYDPINGLSYESAPSSLTVRDGDTLSSIAQEVWGDASFWYLIAQANGLDSTSELTAGQVLSIPNRVANAHNNSDTYSVYDPNEHIGNISPTHPPRPENHGCGVLGTILLAVIAVAVAVVTAGGALAALAPASAGITSTSVGISFLAGTAGAGIGTGVTTGMVIAAGAIGGAVGSIVSQGVGVATGIQKSFNWGGVALAALGGALGAGMGPQGLFGQAGAFGGLADKIGSFGVGALRGITSDVITQGVGVATGIQKSFNWAQVAAAGVGAGVIGAMQANVSIDVGGKVASAVATKLVAGMAGDIASAATLSLINGSDFGDNIIKALPDVIGATIGDLIERPGAQGMGKAGLDPNIAVKLYNNDLHDSLALQAQEQAVRELQDYANSNVAGRGIDPSQLWTPDMSGYNFSGDDGPGWTVEMAKQAQTDDLARLEYASDKINGHGVNLDLFARSGMYSDPILEEAAHNLDMGGNFFTIAGHGNYSMGILDERNSHYGPLGNGSFGEVGATIISTPVDMYLEMQSAGYQKGQIPFFVSCEVNYSNMAQGLATMLNTPVYASKSDVIATPGSVSTWGGLASDPTITLSSKSGFAAILPSGYSGPTLPIIHTITINVNTQKTVYK